MPGSPSRDPRRYVEQALARVFRLERMRALGAPADIMVRGEFLIRESRHRLGEDRWREVLARIPEYVAATEAREQAAAEWHALCRTCAHWGGEGFLSTRLDGEDGVLHFRRYGLGEITCPDGCPTFRRVANDGEK